MAIKLGDYTFEGPYTLTNNLEDKSGIYAILCINKGKYYVIDIGESSEVKKRVETHDRRSCWTKECKGDLTVSVLYTPNLHQAGRKIIEQKIRKQFDPPCGER